MLPPFSSVPFARTVRAREADGVSRPLLHGAVAVALLIGWGMWAVFARISLYKTSEVGRLEVGQDHRTVDALIAGRVLANRLVLGQQVSAGDVLVQLDDTVAAQRLAEARAKHDALVPQLEARRVEMTAEATLRERTREHDRRAVDEARAHRDQAEAAASFAAEQLRRLEGMFRAGAITELDVLRARADGAEKAAALEEARRTVVRLEHKQQADESESEVRSAHIATELSDLLATRATTAAAALAIEHQVDEHVLRAPVSGQIAEIALHGAGAFVERGERLATIVPAGAVVAVGNFAPSSAVGLIRAGQPARIRLDGFPWAQYGSLAAIVTRVGTEVRDGRVRVELVVGENPSSAIPVQHGLPGEIEVEVDRISPLSLLLRTAGQAISGERRARVVAGTP